MYRNAQLLSARKVAVAAIFNLNLHGLHSSGHCLNLRVQKLVMQVTSRTVSLGASYSSVFYQSSEREREREGEIGKL